MARRDHLRVEEHLPARQGDRAHGHVHGHDRSAAHRQRPTTSAGQAIIAHANGTLTGTPRIFGPREALPRRS